MVFQDKTITPSLYFVRHAHADWTPDEDCPLSAKGSRDAARVVDILSACPLSVIYSSPYRRACQIIAPLAEQLGLTRYTRNRTCGSVN